MGRHLDQLSTSRHTIMIDKHRQGLDHLLNLTTKQSEHVVCFGDIHGHLGAAEAAIALTERLEVPAVFLGDYVDRGPDNLSVLHAMMRASESHPTWIFLLGNHDLMLRQVIEGNRHPKGYDERTFSETLPMIPEDQRKAIHHWLLELPAYYRRDNCLFVHGGFTSTQLPIKELSAEELVWTYGIPDDWKGEMVVRGHTLVEEPELRPHDININTRCGFGGCLTGLLLNTTTRKPEWIWSIAESGEIVCQKPASMLNNPLHVDP